MRRALYGAAVLFVIGCAPARAEVRIDASAGGIVDEYLQLFNSLRRTGQRVVINGPCLSACTLVLSTIPRDRLCMTRRAVLGFHAPFDKYGAAAPAGFTRALTDAYPAPIRKWIKRHGGLTETPILLQGRKLTALYPPCRGSSSATDYRGTPSHVEGLRMRRAMLRILRFGGRCEWAACVNDTDQEDVRSANYNSVKIQAVKPHPSSPSAELLPALPR